MYEEPFQYEISQSRQWSFLSFQVMEFRQSTTTIKTYDDDNVDDDHFVKCVVLNDCVLGYMLITPTCIEHLPFVLP